MKAFPDSRKAQITVFIIIGIILVLSVGVYTYLRTAGIKPAEIFQPKAPPVVAFIDACIEKTASDALSAMGDQGGYITLPDNIALDPTKHVNLIPGVGGEVSPKVPYWYFEGANQIPSIEYMQVQVETYIDQNLAFCLENYTDLRDEYMITEISGYSADVVFTEQETVIGLSYAVDIQPRGQEEITSVEQFLVRLDIPVRRMWQLANDLLNAENEKTFFENMTMNVMSSHSPEDIPFSGMLFECGRKQWLLSDIKRKTIKAIEPAVTGIRFKNTDHPPFLENDDDYRRVHDAVQDWRESEIRKPLRLPDDIPEDSYEYFQYYFDFTDRNYDDFKVVSTYKKEWGMNMLSTPNQYGVMKSSVQSLQSRIIQMLLCLNTYHFVYDVTYPVMISINDPEAMHNTGYVFRFAFPVQIFHNAPDRTLLPTTIIEPIEFASDVCGFLAPEEHTIRVRDRITNAELSKVNLTFQCLTIACDLGYTRTNNRHLQWSGQFPEGCYAPIITANRSGYLYTEKQHDGTEPFYIDMYPTQTVKFDVKRHTETAPGVARFIEPGMYAIINVESINPPLSVFDVFDSEDRFFTEDTFELLRADATYQLSIMLLKRISEEEDLLVGGWVGNWTVSMEDMLDAEKVVFHIPEKFPTPTTDIEILGVYGLMTNRTLFPEIVPEIIRSDEYTGEEEEQ